MNTRGSDPTSRPALVYVPTRAPPRRYVAPSHGWPLADRPRRFVVYSPGSI
jgi:hypothetical protein